MGYGISVRLVVFWHKDLRANQMVCLECGYHVRVNSDERIHQLIDQYLDHWMRICFQVIRCNFVIAKPTVIASRKPNQNWFRWMLYRLASVNSITAVALGVMDFRFMGGSMGSVVGEKLTRLVERAQSGIRDYRLCLWRC